MVAVVVVAVLLVIVQVLSMIAGGIPASEPREEQWPYSIKGVMTPPELQLYRRLLDALPDFCVWPQVQMSAALAPPSGEERVKWLNKIHQKSFDYLICDESGRPMVAIELDDKTHRRSSRRKADATKDRACRDGGLPLLRWNVVPSDIAAEVTKATTRGLAPEGANLPG